MVGAEAFLQLSEGKKLKKGKISKGLSRIGEASHVADSEAAVTMLEVSLIIPVLILFILAFIDLVRVIAVQGILTHVAEQTLQVAATMPNFDVDIRTADPNSPEYQRFLLARQRIFQDAAKLPLQTLLTDSSTPSNAQLVRFSYQDPTPASGGTPPDPFSADVALLRPGERVEVGGAGTAVYLNHETYAYPGPTALDPPIERLLRSEPIMVEIHANVWTFIPFLGPITTKGVAQGFRDSIPRGPMPDEALAATTVVTPWPSPTPSATPYPFADPTPRPTPGGCEVDRDSMVAAKLSIWKYVPDESRNPTTFPNCPPLQSARNLL